MSTLSARVDLPPAAASVPTARRLVVDLLALWGAPHDRDDAGLVVSELVANVVDHVGGDAPFTLEVTSSGDWLRISVADGSAIRPVVRELESDSSRGRGMRMVEQIAQRWGAEDHQGGKRVWVELAPPGCGLPEGRSAVARAGSSRHPAQVPTDPVAEDVVGLPLRAQFEAFVDEHRRALQGCLEGLTEEQARRSLVPSRTTLLGLVKHATFVEKVWFDEAVTCRSRAEIGIPATPDESFVLLADDTIAGVQRAHREACASSRRATSSLGLDDLLHGNRRGPLPLRWVYLHVLRELAQHCGHADILREQVLR